MKKKLLILLALLGGAAVVYAQVVETYSFGATANNVTRVNIGRTTFNEQNCNAAGLAFDCTEAQLQAVPGFESARIYPDTEAGRTDLIQDTVLIPWFQDILSHRQSWDDAKARINWANMSRAEKDAVCASFTPALSVGCELY